MNEEEFVRGWHERAGCGLFILVAKSSEERRYLCAQLSEKWGQNQTSVHLRRCDSAHADDALALLLTPSLLGQTEALIIDEAHLCTPDFFQRLERFLRDESGCKLGHRWGLLLCFLEINQQVKPLFLKKGLLLNLNGEKPWQTQARWQRGLQHTARRSSYDLTQGAAAVIVERCGNSRLLAESELARLLLLVPKGSEIDEKLAAALVKKQQIDRIWPLVSAVELEDRAGAWIAIRSMSPGAQGPSAIAGMRSHFQSLLIFSRTAAHSTSAKEPWQLRRDLQRRQRAEKLGGRELAKILRSLHSVDEAHRLGELQPEEMLQAWFLRWAQDVDE